MAFDQNITYRVNVDDSNFQAKLTQMRASMDATVGGGGFGGSPAMNFGMMNVMMGSRGSYGMPSLAGGFADFGGQVQPVTFTPPAIAMQPHFGMFQIHQTLGQAGLAATFGPAGIAMNQMRAFGMTSARDVISPNMSYGEYINYSTRSFSDRMGANATAFAGAGLSLGLNVAGGAAGAGLGGMIGGGLIGGLAGGILGGMAVGAIGSAAADRAAENIAIQSTLANSSFRYYQGTNTDPVTGRGFNRGDRQNIATNLMRMEANDNRFNTTDYRQILETGAQMDLFSGTKDAEDFTKRFKDLVSTVKTVTSTLHTSLREGMETIRGLRDMGITDPTMQQSMVLRSETMGRMSGRTGMEMMAVGQTGAEMFRGTGIAMQRGFEINQQNTTLVRQMLNQGTISREVVAQAGGELGLAQQMTAGALSGFQTLQGRGAMMAAFNPATGAFDSGMVARMMGGDAMGIMAGAAGTMSNPANMFKFQAHQEEMISKLSPMEMQMFGVAQRMASARTLQNAFGGDLKDIFMAESKRQGIGIEQIKTEIGMLTMDPAKFKEQQQAQITQMTIQQNLESARDAYLGPKLLTNAFNRAVTQPLSEGLVGVGNRVATGVENTVSNIRDSLFGAAFDAKYVNQGAITESKAYLQERVNAEAKRAADAGETVDLRGIARKVTGGGKVVDVSEMGVLDWLGTAGGGTTGTAVGDFLRASKGKQAINGVAISRFASDDALTAAQQASGEDFIRIGKQDGQVIAIRAEQARGIVEARQKMQVSQEEVDKQKGAIANSKTLQSLRGRSKVSLADIGQAVLGDSFDMNKYMSGGYGKEAYARIQAVADVGGFDNASEEIYQASSSDMVSNLMGRVGGEYSNQARNAAGAAARDLETMGLGGSLADKVRGGNAGLMRALSLLMDNDAGNDTSGRVGLRSAGLKQKQIEDIQGVIEGVGNNPEKKKALARFLKSADSFMLSNAMAGDTAAQASGNEAAGLAGVAGPLTAQNMEALMQMSKTLKQQIEIISAMQAKLDASFKK